MVSPVDMTVTPVTVALVVMYAAEKLHEKLLFNAENHNLSAMLVMESKQLMWRVFLRFYKRDFLM